jgi:Domain of unknown function (DUF4112)
MPGDLSPLPPNEPPVRIIVPGSAPPPDAADRDRARAVARELAWWMDSAFVIPGTDFRVGFDALIGLIPFLGDLIGMAISSYLILIAARLGVPRVVLMRMLLNVGADAVLGAIPLAGDVLDAAWRANAKNARLLEEALADPKAAGRSSFWVVLGMLTAVLAVCVGAIVLTVWLVKLVIRAME